MTPKIAYEVTGEAPPAFCGDAETVGAEVGLAVATVGDASARVDTASAVAGTSVGTSVGIAEAVTGATVAAAVRVTGRDVEAGVRDGARVA